MIFSTRPHRLTNRVRERRESLGLTQSQVARRAGLARQTVHQLEGNPGRAVTALVAMRLAKALETTVCALFIEEAI